MRKPGRRRLGEELEASWTLGPDELAMLAGKRGPTRLGFAVVLRFFARQRRFPDPAEERGLNRLELVGETMRHTLDVLATVAPE